MKKILGLVPLFLMACAGQAFAQRYAIFPRFASGAGWSSEFHFTNQGISNVSGITVDFYDQNGAKLLVESNLGGGTSYAFSLGAGATETIRVTPGVTLVQGYVMVTYPSFRSPVRGSEIFRYEQNGTVEAEVGVPQQEQGDHFSFPVEMDSSRGIRTAVAFTNPSGFNSTTETLIVNLIKPDGSVQATATVPMQSGQHLAGYLDQDWLFPGLDNFTGSIGVSSPLGVGVLALRQDKQAFGAISTDGGPILGPFALTGQAIQEEEPNGTDLSAQPIFGSTIVTGTIGETLDADIFYFVGRKDHIVSITCDTQGTDSYLDSVLAVFDGNLNQLAYNDQNGLAPGSYPQDDSFIQLVLPADGIYYVMLLDFYDDGGPEYTYTLHLNLP